MGRRCFRMARYSLWPIDHTIVYDNTPENAEIRRSFFRNMLWEFFFGVELALGLAVLCVVACLTLVGIPFGVRVFRMIHVAFSPLDWTASPRKPSLAAPKDGIQASSSAVLPAALPSTSPDLPKETVLSPSPSPKFTVSPRFAATSPEDVPAKPPVLQKETVSAPFLPAPPKIIVQARSSVASQKAAPAAPPVHPKGMVPTRPSTLPKSIVSARVPSALKKAVPAAPPVFPEKTISAPLPTLPKNIVLARSAAASRKTAASPPIASPKGDHIGPPISQIPASRPPTPLSHNKVHVFQQTSGAGARAPVGKLIRSPRQVFPTREETPPVSKDPTP